MADDLHRMFYDHPDGTKYLLNLLDTPGHADFSSELLRSLLPSQGALLLVDAAQVSDERRSMSAPKLTKLFDPRAFKRRRSVSWTRLASATSPSSGLVRPSPRLSLLLC